VITVEERGQIRQQLQAAGWQITEEEAGALPLRDRSIVLSLGGDAVLFIEGHGASIGVPASYEAWYEVAFSAPTWAEFLEIPVGRVTVRQILGI